MDRVNGQNVFASRSLYVSETTQTSGPGKDRYQLIVVLLRPEDAAALRRMENEAKSPQKSGQQGAEGLLGLRRRIRAEGDKAIVECPDAEALRMLVPRPGIVVESEAVAAIWASVKRV